MAYLHLICCRPVLSSEMMLKRIHELTPNTLTPSQQLNDLLESPVGGSRQSNSGFTGFESRASSSFGTLGVDGDKRRRRSIMGDSSWSVPVKTEPVLFPRVPQTSASDYRKSFSPPNEFLFSELNVLNLFELKHRNSTIRNILHSLINI